MDVTVEKQTAMYLIYVDESYDDTHFAYSAVFVNAFRWNSCFNYLLKWRKDWFDSHQIPYDYELHATDFTGGRGKYPPKRDKPYRAKLFFEAIGRVELMEDIMVMNAITQNKKQYMELFERMLNRIARTLEDKNAFGILICDEGNENNLTSIVRRMQKENHVPSTDFYRAKGINKRNLPIKQIIEDPLFKTSKSSYFIQLSDFLAFSLLRNEKPMEGTLAVVQEAFEQMDKVLIKDAFGKDPRMKGIIRT